MTSSEVPQSPNAVCPLLNGMQAPGAMLNDADGKPFDVGARLKTKPAVLVFYRGGWWPHCNKQLVQLHDLYPQLEELGVDLIAISPDKPAKAKESENKHNLQFPLLSDASIDIARAFGVAYQVDAQMLAALAMFGVNLDEASGESHHQLPVPAVFMTRTNNVIQFEYVNPDYKVRLHPDLLLAAARISLKWYPVHFAHLRDRDCGNCQMPFGEELNLQTVYGRADGSRVTLPVLHIRECGFCF